MVAGWPSAGGRSMWVRLGTPVFWGPIPLKQTRLRKWVLWDLGEACGLAQLAGVLRCLGSRKVSCVH